MITNYDIKKSDNIISLIGYSGAMLVDPSSPVRLDGWRSSIYNLTGLSKPWIVAVIDEGIGIDLVEIEARRLPTASPRPSTIVVFASDALYTHSGNKIPHGKLIKVSLSNFNSLIIASEESTSIIRRGPDPAPWIVDWDDPRGNPVKAAICDGIIPGLDPEREFSDYVKKMKHKQLSPGKRDAFMKESARACPLFLEKNLW